MRKDFLINCLPAAGGRGQHGTVGVQKTWRFLTEEGRNWYGWLTLHLLASLWFINRRKRVMKTTFDIVELKNLCYHKRFKPNETSQKLYCCFTQGHPPAVVSSVWWHWLVPFHVFPSSSVPRVFLCVAVSLASSSWRLGADFWRGLKATLDLLFSLPPWGCSHGLPRGIFWFFVVVVP